MDRRVLDELGFTADEFMELVVKERDDQVVLAQVEARRKSKAGMS